METHLENSKKVSGLFFQKAKSQMFKKILKQASLVKCVESSLNISCVRFRDVLVLYTQGVLFYFLKVNLIFLEVVFKKRCAKFHKVPRKSPGMKCFLVKVYYSVYLYIKRTPWWVLSYFKKILEAALLKNPCNQLTQLLIRVF